LLNISPLFLVCHLLHHIHHIHEIHEIHEIHNIQELGTKNCSIPYSPGAPVKLLAYPEFRAGEMAISISVLSGGLFVLTLILHRLWARYLFNQKYKFPNVVPGWPVVGNSFDVPFPGGMWGVETARKYGEMYARVRAQFLTCWFDWRLIIFGGL
jgi:hypothetical protein